MTQTHNLTFSFLHLQIIKNAFNKRLDIEIRHDNYGVLLVNKQTGDVLFKNNDKNNFFEELLEQIFLAQAGEKTAIILNTSHNNNQPSEGYKASLQNNRVNIVELTASAGKIPGYGGHSINRILVNFIIDLKNPKFVFVKSQGTVFDILEQETLTAVGKELSTLPDIEALKKYNQLGDISTRIAWANVDEIIDNKALILQLANITKEKYGECLLKAVKKTLQTQTLNSGNFLYTPDNIGQILETLRLVEENNIGTTILAFLVKNFVEQTKQKLSQQNNHITKHAVALINYAIAVFNRQNEAGKEDFVNIVGTQIFHLYQELVKIRQNFNIALPEEFTPPSSQIYASNHIKDITR
jgi:hypothetical protein